VLALCVDLGDNLVQIARGVHILPEGFTICGVVATTIILFGTVVDKWNTETSQRENGSSAETLVVTRVVAHEAGVVMVVNKKTEQAQVFEVALLSSVSVLDVAHAFACAEYVSNSVVHGVVEKTSDVVLVRADVSGISIEAFTHLENA